MRFKQYIINETNLNNISDVDMINSLVKDCKPFLKELLKSLKNDRLFLLSGRKNTVNFFKRKIRTDRIPIDTPVEYHNYIDDLFHKKFGWKARSNSIFCTGSFDTAEEYGNKVYMIFPIDQYKILWSPKVGDLYTKFFEDDNLLPENADDIMDFDNYELEQQAIDDLNFEYEEYVNLLEPDEDIMEYDDWLENENYLEDKKYELAEIKADQNKRENEETLKEIIYGYTDKNLNKALKSKHEIMVNTKEYYGVDHNLNYDMLLKYFTKYGIKKATQEMIDLL